MNKKPSKRIAFLLGSGVSMPAGFPGVGKITERVLSGENVVRHSDSTYYIDETKRPDYVPPNLWKEGIPEITDFLRILSEKIQKITKDNPANYEFLFYLVDQLALQEWGVIDNPLIIPFWESIKPEVENFIQKHKEFYDPLNFLRECENYIQDVVAALLRRTPDRLDYLNLFLECHQDHDFDHIDVFTLNHDLLMEEFFRSHSIKYTDGFDDPVDNIRTWDPQNLRSNRNKARLLKLHGSIDWCGFSYHHENIMVSFKAIVDGTSEFNVFNFKGHTLRPPDKRLFLTGTNNKLINYNWDIWTELHYEFFSSIKDIDRMIVIGYGFGDTGINQRIREWVSKSLNRKIIIVDRDPCALETRPFLRFQGKNWQDHNRMKFIGNSIEKISWNHLKEHL